MSPPMSTYSETSGDEDDQMPSSTNVKSFGAALLAKEVKVMHEEDVFKPAMVDQDEASFVLEDAIIFKSNLQPPRIANLLDIQLEDPAVLAVYGRLAIEPDEYQYSRSRPISHSCIMG